MDRSHRATITLTGDERRKWLHTISTQHVSDLPDGAVVENLSLDGQGRVEDHWLQTQLDGVTVIDTEPWRGEPLLAYLRKMVFWADVVVEPADLAVLSLLGPRVGDPAVLDGHRRRRAARRGDGIAAGRRRFRPHAPRRRGRPGGAARRGAGVAGRASSPRASGPRACGPTRRTGSAALRPRLGVDTDERTIPHEVGWIGGPGEGAVHLDKGCYRGQETVARVHNLGKPPRMLVLLHLDGSADRPGDRRSGAGRRARRSGGSAPSSTTSTSARSRWRCSSAGVPADTAADHRRRDRGGRRDRRGLDAATADAVGAGRLAVERLRSDQR